MNSVMEADLTEMQQRPSFKEIPKEMARESGLSQSVCGEFHALFTDIYTKAIKSGHAIRFPGVGLMVAESTEDGVRFSLHTKPRQRFNQRRMGLKQILSNATDTVHATIPEEPRAGVEGTVKRAWDAFVKVGHDYYRNRSGMSLGNAGILVRLNGEARWLVDERLELEVAAQSHRLGKA